MVIPDCLLPHERRTGEIRFDKLEAFEDGSVPWSRRNGLPTVGEMGSGDLRRRVACARGWISTMAFLHDCFRAISCA